MVEGRGGGGYFGEGIGEVCLPEMDTQVLVEGDELGVIACDDVIVVSA